MTDFVGYRMKWIDGAVIGAVSAYTASIVQMLFTGGNFTAPIMGPPIILWALVTGGVVGALINNFM